MGDGRAIVIIVVPCRRGLLGKYELCLEKWEMANFPLEEILEKGPRRKGVTGSYDPKSVEFGAGSKETAR